MPIKSLVNGLYTVHQWNQELHQGSKSHESTLNEVEYTVV